MIVSDKKSVSRFLSFSLAMFVATACVGVSAPAFLLWNLFLAWIPYWVSGRLRPASRGTFFFGFLFFVWLVFLPNCFYIITDYVHLHLFPIPAHQEHIPTTREIIEILLYSSFMWAGFVLGFSSIRRVFEAIKFKTPRKILVAILALCSLGVVLGRYLRFNSWDLFVSPLRLLNDLQGLSHFNGLHLLVIFVALTGFLLIIYDSFFSRSSDDQTG